MKKLLSSLLVATMLVTMLSGCSDDSDKIVIGINKFADHEALNSAQKGFIDYFKEKGYDEDKIEFVIKDATGDAVIADTIANGYVNDEVDLIFAIATPSAQSSYKVTKGTDIPVVFTAVTDAVDCGIVKSNEKPGGNVTGVSDIAPLEKQLLLIKEFLPNVKSIGMLYYTGEVNGKLQTDQVKELGKKYGIEVKVQGVGSTTEIASAAEQLLNSGVDCIYNITDNTVVSATPAIVSKANEYKKPVFAAEDGKMKNGLLASESINYYELGKQAGAQAYAILVDKKSPKDIPVEAAKETKLYVNKEVAKKLGITIPSSVNERATYLD